MLGPARLLKQRGYSFIWSQKAEPEDIARVHGREHIERVKAGGLFDAAALAAGAGITATEPAVQGEMSFALVRPPGHHDAANLTR